MSSVQWKITKQKKVQDLLILGKRERQAMGKCTSSKIHRGSAEEEKRSLALVKVIRQATFTKDKG